jgi:hypothetical protein
MKLINVWGGIDLSNSGYRDTVVFIDGPLEGETKSVPHDEHPTEFGYFEDGVQIGKYTVAKQGYPYFVYTAEGQ